jgi:Uri superfamily endonuclease
LFLGRFMSATGAYVLLIELRQGFEFTSGRFDGQRLSPGFYAYCGSAKGPGGLSARVRRHMRRDKKIHWHVDYLTAVEEIVQVGVQVDGSECELVGRLLTTPGTHVPIQGFGSSDCAVCTAHLVQLNRRSAFEALGLMTNWQDLA